MNVRSSAGSLNDLFDFSNDGGTNPPLYLNPSTGQPELAPTFTAH